MGSYDFVSRIVNWQPTVRLPRRQRMSRADVTRPMASHVVANGGLGQHWSRDNLPGHDYANLSDVRHRVEFRNRSNCA